jgi:hypothetical protein
MTDQSAKKNAFLTEASTLDDANKVKSNEPSDSENESEEDEYYYGDNPFTQPTTLDAQSVINDVSQNKGSKHTDKSHDSTGEEAGEKRAISAVAPKVLEQDESQVEISSTPAFQCLEEVFYFCFTLIYPTGLK